MSAVSGGIAHTDDTMLLNRNPGEKSFVWLGDIREVRFDLLWLSQLNVLFEHACTQGTGTVNHFSETCLQQHQSFYRPML